MVVKNWIRLVALVGVVASSCKGAESLDGSEEPPAPASAISEEAAPEVHEEPMDISTTLSSLEENFYVTFLLNSKGTYLGEYVFKPSEDDWWGYSGGGYTMDLTQQHTSQDSWLFLFGRSWTGDEQSDAEGKPSYYVARVTLSDVQEAISRVRNGSSEFLEVDSESFLMGTEGVDGFSVQDIDVTSVEFHIP